MSIYGTDISCTDKMLPGVLVSGPRLVAEAVYRRLTTKRGTLLEDSNYGRSIHEYLSLEMTPYNGARIGGELRGEVLKDDRVDSCDVTATVTGTGAMLAIDVFLDCQCGEGPFDLSVKITSETASIIIGTKGAA